MLAKYFCLFSVVIVTVIGKDETETLFNNNFNLLEQDTGGTLRLRSRGKLSEIVNLEKTECIKRVLCKGRKILLALKEEYPSVKWKRGQLVTGGNKWRCSDHSTSRLETIFAKIEDIKRPKENVIELHTTAAGPLEMFEEAQVQIHYQQGLQPNLRQKRSISNPLRKSLNYLDWNISYISSIPFSENDDQVINLFKPTNESDIQTNTRSDMFYSGEEFFFQCQSCHGHTQVSYAFELSMKKINNKPKIMKYMIQIELDTIVKQNYTMDINGEISLTEIGTLWRHAPEEALLLTPIAVFKTLPPINLKVTYTAQTNLQFTSRTKEETHFIGDFTTSGKTVISQKFEDGKPVHNDVSCYNWTVNSVNMGLDTNRTANSTYAIFQNVTLYPSISWPLKDVDVIFGPSIHFSVRPKINAVSTSDGTLRCASCSVVVDVNVSVTDTDFTVDAYGLDIWNITLMSKLSRKFEVLHKSETIGCRADCQGPTEVHSEVTLEKACGEPDGIIIRGDKRFKSLHHIWGDFILFASEEFNLSARCGQPGINCVPCVKNINGDDIGSACADRMVTTILASRITRLAKLIGAEWPNRKLIVEEAWDEARKHGNRSVFSEARAAIVMITMPIKQSEVQNRLEADTDHRILSRMSELAVCSKLNRVARMVKENKIEVCVKKTLETNFTDKLRNKTYVRTLLSKVGTALSRTMSSVKLPTSLIIGASFPPNSSMELICGNSTDSISQDNLEMMQQLVHYPFNDVQFLPEGPASTWCGVETRKCQNCSRNDDEIIETNPWNWCETRTMTMRLAVKLQRLSVLTNANVTVLQAHSSRLGNGLSKLYAEGRAAKIGISQGSPLTTEELSSKAMFAGFDYVHFSSPSYIEVCVKLQEGLEAEVVDFPLNTLLSVQLPYYDRNEFDYPITNVKETRKPLLFDGFSSSAELSQHFKLSMFLSPGVRYVRLDSELINLLELAYDDFKDGFYIIEGSGYRPRSVNRDNINTRHVNERHRFEMGQAAELRPKGKVTDNSLFHLGIALMRSGRSFQVKSLGIGIGAKSDRLYFHICPLLSETETDRIPIDVWDSGNTVLYDMFHTIQMQIAKGGFLITAKPDTVACRPPALGMKLFYFGFELHEEGYCWIAQGDICSQTKEHRYNISKQLQRSLTRAAGTDTLPRSDIMPDIENCILNTCGGCPYAGDIWKQKVIHCTKMILKYLERASVAFQPLRDNVAFFNTENTRSSVHSLACHDGRICAENTQIYSLLLPLITASYRRNNVEELIFDAAANPSPLLEIVEQELAWRAEGTVSVFIDGMTDITALRNVLKILMIFNKNVTEVLFYTDPDIDQADVTNTLQSKLEEWASSVCANWSRIVVAPYKMELISHARKRRSLRRSKTRNENKKSMNTWEVDWILRT